MAAREHEFVRDQASATEEHVPAVRSPNQSGLRAEATVLSAVATFTKESKHTV